ncbi:MAG: hypothetical protein ACRDZR_14410 [Acidimicrobiales bacterium]
MAGLALLAGTAPAWAGTAGASPGGHGTPIVPGDLLVSTSTYQDDPGIVATTTQLPPGCSATATAPDPCGTAVANGTYPYVFNNSVVDASFGITSPIVLDELSPEGHEIGTVEVPNSSEPGVAANADQMVTSFSSKSELALNLSPNGQYVTFMGYKAGVGTVDVSNANTPGDVDPTSADPGAYYRVVGELGQDGRIRYTETNAFSGDNGRAAISARVGGRTVVYGAGNAGNGANPEPPQVVLGSGAQFVQPSDQPEAAQDPGQPTPIGSFNVYKQLGYTGDKVAKDDNFRGVTIEDTVVYYTKGSGSNGVNTVYFVDTTGKACPGGTGVPEPGAPLPGSANVLSYTPTAAPTIVKKHSTTTNPGLVPEDMCILRGFPTVSAGTTTASTFPFGMWFANPDTLYVADEGNGDNTDTTASATANGTYTTAASSPTAGLQKWVFNQAAQSWGLAYTLQAGLDLGQPYSVPGYPTGLNDGPGGTTLPWAPATDGLRNLTGRVNSNGTVSIWATTSTVSGSGDQGADPNELVEVTDQLGATAPPSWAHFQTVMAPQSGTVVRGVSFTPGTRACQGPDRNRDADHDGDGCTRPSPGPHHPGRGSDGEDAVGPATGPRGS